MKECRPEETPNRTWQEQSHHPRGQCRVLLYRNPRSVQNSGLPTLPDSEAQTLANASHTSVTPGCPCPCHPHPGTDIMEPKQKDSDPGSVLVPGSP